MVSPVSCSHLADVYVALCASGLTYHPLYEISDASSCLLWSTSNKAQNKTKILPHFGIIMSEKWMKWNKGCSWHHNTEFSRVMLMLLARLLGSIRESINQKMRNNYVLEKVIRHHSVCRSALDQINFFLSHLGPDASIFFVYGRPSERRCFQVN